MIISLDTETTGLDFVHGAKPFLVTTCDQDGVVRFWEWDVDPLTRQPLIPDEEYGDLEEIVDLIDAAELVYLQNAKFDWRALNTIGIYLPWEKVRDTIVMGHLLASNHRHNLTDMVQEYLRRDISKYEKNIEEITKAARIQARREFPQWKIADEGVEGMPSVKSGSKREEDKPWKNDMWLPRALAKHSKKFIPDQWKTACSEYANGDSSHTLPLGLEMEDRIRRRGLWDIYMHRMNLPRVACEMECYGVTVIGEYTEATIQRYEEYVAEAGDALHAIAAEYGHELEMGVGAALNDNMRDFFYGSCHMKCPRCNYDKRIKHWNGEQPDGGVCPKCAKSSRRKVGVQQPLVMECRENLNLPVVESKKTGNAALDKDAMQEYSRTLEGTPLEFVKILSSKRKHDTDLTYMQAYRRYWVPVKGEQGRGFYRLHPSLNPCATDHLRWASNDPNLQNVGTQEDQCEECEGRGKDCEECGGTGKGSRTSVRCCFGPAPGREWYSMDFKNIEKRVPAYECMEPKLIEIFEKPNEPPYWGSDHLLIASLLFPNEFWPIAEIEGEFKRKHLQKYKKCKNTNFAKQYGAGRRKVEATSGVVGAYDLIDRGLPELAKLQAHYLAEAKRTGWVCTLPDRTVDAKQGYPILASRTQDGGVLSTTPFNYHVSGTACWCKNTALIRCSAKLAEWRRDGFDAYMALEIHDEILFDFPRERVPGENQWRAMELRKLMEQSGEDLIPRIPTPVSVEYHPVSWAKGIAC